MKPKKSFLSRISLLLLAGLYIAMCFSGSFLSRLSGVHRPIFNSDDVLLLLVCILAGFYQLSGFDLAQHIIKKREAKIAQEKAKKEAERRKKEEEVLKKQREATLAAQEIIEEKEKQQARIEAAERLKKLAGGKIRTS